MNDLLFAANSLFSTDLSNQFHFLRPLWLLSILPALWLAWYFWQQKTGAENWRNAIDENLIEHLLETGTKNCVRWPWLLLLSAWILAATALAGPTWEKLPQPVHQKQDALVIILDLSLSMQAEDIKPSRLVRARHKILDILNQRDEGLSALIAYSADAHIVSPLTDDNATVANLLPALTPTMMPDYGSDPVSALTLATQLFKNSGLSEGRILLVTDGITDNDLQDIDNTINRSGFELSILGIGTTQGAPIPTQAGFIKDSTGNIVVPKLPRQQLDTLARLNDGRYTDVSLNDNDIEFLLPNNVTDLNEKTTISERQFDQWYDRGHLLVLFLLPIVLLAFRRGWLLMLPLLLTLTAPQDSYGLEWKDLWQRADQQAANALANGDANTAANTFNNKLWKGSAQYKAEDFEAAAHNFEQFDDADSHYNRANALAKAGKLDDAINAYNQALEQQPDMEDAQFNKELLEKLKQQQQNSSDQKNDEDSESDSEQSKDDKKQQQSKQNKEDQQEGGKNQQNADNKDDSSSDKQKDNTKQSAQDPNDGADLPEEQSSKEKEQQAQQNEQQQDKDKQQEQSAAQQQDQQENQSDKKQQAQVEQSKTDKENQQKQQALEQWLRQIPDEPSGLLRRKFDYEHRLRQQRQTSNKREQPKW